MNKKYNITKKFLIKEYTINKKSAYQIAKEVGCGNLTIYKNLKKNNINIRTQSEAQKGVSQGKNNGMFGVHRFGKDNPNYKHGKCKNNICIDCGAKINYYATRCIKCGHQYQSTLKIGHLNPAWINGATLEIYPSKFNKQLKESI